MKKYSILISTIIFFFYVDKSFAQYSGLSNKFTQTQLFGSSRNIAMGGIGTAIGGDISNISLNPAGLAFYRGNDFSFNLNVVDKNTSTNYLGTNNESGSTKFNIPNFGIVFAEPIKNYSGKDNSKGWSSYAFGLSYSRVNLFSNNLTFVGFNNSSSLSQRFSENANKNGLGTNSLSEQAYYAYIINYDTIQNKYVPVSKGNIDQSINDKLSGAQSQMSFAGAVSYENKLYLGASMNVLSVNSSSAFTLGETGIIDTTNNLSSFNYFENSQINGSGINFKFGLIFRPTDFLRIGANLQSPSWLGLSENYDVSLASNFGKGDSSFTFTPLYYNYAFSYKLAPKYNVGMALFFKKYGFISGEVEYVDYSNSRFQNSTDATLNGDINNQIKNKFTSTQNYKIGAELKLELFSLRTGYAYQGNPFSDVKNIDGSRSDFSYGFGMRFEDFYVDASYVYSYSKNDYVPYSTSGNSPTAFMKNTRNSFMVTVGSKF